MGIPAHAPWLPGYIRGVQAVLIILTVAGLFPDGPLLILAPCLPPSFPPFLPLPFLKHTIIFLLWLLQSWVNKYTSLETGLDTKTIKLFSSPFFKNIALKTLEQWRKEIVHNSLSISFCFFPILVHKSECTAWKEFCYIDNFSLLTFFLHSELLTF